MSSSSTTSKVFLLRNLGIPVMSTLSDMSREMRLSTEILKSLIFRADHFYRVFDIKKKGKSKGARKICQPSRKLKALQAWILRNILDKVHSSPFSTGFEKGQSIKDNANPHVGANFMLNIDLEDFFPSISSNKVYTVFSSLGYNSTISSALTRICCYKQQLPQGSPASPKLANLVCLKLDYRIHGYAGRRGIIFTRYADDITLSAQTLKKIDKAKDFILSIIPNEDLVINKNKISVCGPRKQKKVTGLILSTSSVGIGREKYREVKSKIHYLSVGRSSDFNHVIGLLAFIKSVDEKNHRRLMNFAHKMMKKYKVNLPGIV
ncbi:retron St85 family RNA-directed DNA polymerase [uncultured Pantoea sp.]|uniref:retron St85 family RNA-directed DNA polymerase n=1 Tax=uncultured Pantoea sp. TaxID=218084 RepID=UPI0027D9BAD1|nr:retron St85 family RNA-directed DNA polymerase [uncultured Pantoea sp.]